MTKGALLAAEVELRTELKKAQAHVSELRRKHSVSAFGMEPLYAALEHERKAWDALEGTQFLYRQMYGGKAA